MRDFVKALYADLLHRVDVVIADIKGTTYDDDIKDRFIASTITMLQGIRKELQGSLDTGVLELDIFTTNNLFKFNKLDREFKAIHSYRYLALKNYDKPEKFFFKLITKIYSEHRILAIPPIVSTISNHDYYYWAVPYFEIIALPCGEENSLLNLPDLYHEVGHLLHSMYQGKSCEQSSQIAEKHFESELVRVQDEGTAQHYSETLEIAKYLWLNSWIEEFTCDLIGTYMTGPSYAWTNLKLLATGHGSIKVFEYSETHPADEARMRVIIKMLDKLGLKAEKEKVEAAWKVFLKDTEMHKPKDYFLLYPDKLLQQVVDEFFTFYQNTDIASYPEILKNGGDSVAKILNDAWDMAQRDPGKYSDNEAKVIDELRKSFGL